MQEVLGWIFLIMFPVLTLVEVTEFVRAAVIGALDSWAALQLNLATLFAKPTRSGAVILTKGKILTN
jgi:hypothetical protein